MKEHRFTWRLLAIVITILSVQRRKVANSLTIVDPQQSVSGPPPSRRAFLMVAGGTAFQSATAAAAAACCLLLLPSGGQANAAVTDETDTFADNWWSSTQQQQQQQPGKAPSSSSSSSSSTVVAPQSQKAAVPSDEVVISVSIQDIQARGGLGVELADIEFRTNLRVYVKSLKPGGLASDLGIQKDWVVVALNGQSTERTNAQGVAQLLSKAVRQGGDAVEFRFRDPFVFQEKLKNLQAYDDESSSVTTQVAPAGDTTQRNPDGSVQSGRSITSQSDQKFTVTQLIPPKLCKRGAKEDDLLEISYLGTVVETGAVFDGSAIKINGQGIPGRGNDVSLFFVLGKQPFGQFPPGWDVGLVGMCVGERRRLIIPPGLAYGSTGLPRRGIPPNATLQYDITLVSLNGLATPQ